MAKTRADPKAEQNANNMRKALQPPKAQHPPKSYNRIGGETDAVAGLFQNKHKHVHDGQKPTGITKQRAETKISGHLHPLFLHFKTATDSYRAGADASLREDLESIHKELIARLDRIDMNGKELIIDRLPTRSELEKLKAEREESLKSFSEDTIDTEFTRVDGSILISAQPLGRTMAHFEKKVKETKAKLEPLFRELKEVDTEIARVLEDLGEDDAKKKATAKFDEELKKLQAEADEALQQTMDDIANARKDDKKMSADSKRKLEEFLNSW